MQALADSPAPSFESRASAQSILRWLEGLAMSLRGKAFRQVLRGCHGLSDAASAISRRESCSTPTRWRCRSLGPAVSTARVLTFGKGRHQASDAACRRHGRAERASRALAHDVTILDEACRLTHCAIHAQRWRILWDGFEAG